MDPDYVYQLFYEPDENIFTDEGGYVIFNPYRYITPNDLMLFKKKKEYTMLFTPEGYPVELFYM